LPLQHRPTIGTEPTGEREDVLVGDTPTIEELGASAAADGEQKPGQSNLNSGTGGLY
jgi:hypothetical protein